MADLQAFANSNSYCDSVARKGKLQELNKNLDFVKHHIR